MEVIEGTDNEMAKKIDWSTQSCSSCELPEQLQDDDPSIPLLGCFIYLPARAPIRRINA